MRTSAKPEICGRIETAPGQDATHLPVATISSMPSAHGLQRPGLEAERHGGRLNSAIGMIKRLTSGAAIRLATSP